MTIEVEVCDSLNEKTVYEVNFTDSILQLKERISERIGIPPTKINLFYHGQKLMDDKTFIDQGIGRVIMYRGGKKINPTIHIFAKIITLRDLKDNIYALNDQDIQNNQLKNVASEKTKIPISEIKLIYQGRELNDEENFDELRAGFIYVLEIPPFLAEASVSCQEYSPAEEVKDFIRAIAWRHPFPIYYSDSDFRKEFKVVLERTHTIVDVFLFVNLQTDVRNSITSGGRGRDGGGDGDDT